MSFYVTVEFWVVKRYMLRYRDSEYVKSPAILISYCFRLCLIIDFHGFLPKTGWRAAHVLSARVSPLALRR